jgi:haloalkane dehalogenase
MTTTPSQPAWLDRNAYPFAARSLALPEGRLHYVDEGPADAADVLVLVHGTPTWSFEYRHLIHALRPRHRVIALDHLGFGLSERPPAADYRPEAHARRFAAFITALGLPRFTLVTHDFGGPIALPFAAAHPERLAGLVLFNTWLAPFTDPTMLRRARWVAGRLGRFLYRSLNASLRLIMPSAYARRRRLTPAIHAQYLAPFRDRDARDYVLHTLARALLDSREHYAALHARRDVLARLPTTILWGLADSAFGPAYLERLREALPAADVHALADAGHWPHEEAPDQVAALVAAHLARHPAARVTSPACAPLQAP